MRKTMFFKVILLMIVTGIVFTACKKDQPSDPSEFTVELEFVIEQSDFDNLKSTRDDVPQCDEQWSMDYVVFAFAGNEYWSPIFTVDGEILTQAVKVNVPQSGSATYALTKFLVYHDVQGNGPSSDDLLLRAAPEPNSTYHHLMVNKLDLDVDVEAFRKKQVIIDVLCFEDLYYQNFGFSWFELNQVRIERQCFFGDVCADDLALFDVEGSLYKLQENGLQMDMPAIMQIKAYKKVNGEWGDPLNVFDNLLYENGDPWYGEGNCMEVYWANDEDLEEEFKFELYVHLPILGTPQWVFIDEYVFFDDNCPDPGADGVVDFVIGDCQVDDADFQYDWPDEIIVKANTFAIDYSDPGLAYKWFYFNDETNLIDNTLGSFVEGPAPTPGGTGSVEIGVSGTERVCLATYQFAGTPLAEITTFAFSTYNPSAGNGQGVNASGYLNFNVDFDGSDTWQKRLVYVPSDNGTVIPDTWQEWDVINGGTSLWRWSGNLWGGAWPDGLLNPSNGLVTLNQILAAYPGVRIRISDPFVGIRVGEPYANGYTENLDVFKFGTTSTAVFDFE